MGIKDKSKDFAGRMKLGPHHTIERFGVIFTALTTMFALLFVGTIASAALNSRSALDTTALYTPTFTTSKTQLAGSVEGVYISKDEKRAMILMKFKDSAAGSFSANAENYQAFLSGSNSKLGQEGLKTNIEGSIVMFGSTGYMGVVLDSDQPFQQQILNLTLRANSELVYNAETSGSRIREDLRDDNSFQKYDQWRLYFNPGASQAEVSDALSGGRIDPGALYSELVIQSQEDEIREEMDDQLKQMQVDLSRIAEYNAEMDRTNVDGVRIVPPKVPAPVAGDQVLGEPAHTDKSGKEIPSTLRLDTKWTSPRGYDFDWRDGSVTEGYLDEIVPQDESYVTYLANKAQAGNSDGSDANQRFQPNDMEWKLSNGTDLKQDYTSSDTTMKPLKDIMNNLTQAYQTYYRNKIDYQVGSYSELLELEVQLRNVRSAQSINNSDDALLTY